jgi:low affinity Fe/Cu permease
VSKSKNKKGLFVCFAEKAAHWSGHPATFIGAVSAVVLWGVSGPLFGFSDTWQLVINTSTTIITFLMVFLIQNTQNRDSKAVQLKLDELIRATEGAHTVLLDLEELSEAELDKIREKYEEIANEARRRLRAGKSDTDIPEVILDADPDIKGVKK